MREHHIGVRRTARYFTSGDASRGVAEVWFACHGYGQLAARFLEKLRVLDDGRRYLVAPEGLSRFYLSESPTERRVGATWMTREDRLAEIDDYVRYLDDVYADVFGSVDRARVKVYALGFSQGTSTVSRWATLGKATIDRLILWGGEFPPDLDLTVDAVVGRLRGAQLTLVYGRSDEYITPKVLSGIGERLRQHGIPYEEIPFDGGHELNEAVLRHLGG
ncbi:MAG: phospholipase [Gemmatimonadetes bacterium]|nr:MAG: phospholipase [Gemmatimonadota bacterium]